MKTESRNFRASARVNPAMSVLVLLLVGFVVLIPYVYIQVQRALDADQSYLQHAAELRAQSYQLTALSRVAVAGDQGAFVELNTVVRDMDQTWEQLRSSDPRTRRELSRAFTAYNNIYRQSRWITQTFNQNKAAMLTS